MSLIIDFFTERKPFYLESFPSPLALLTILIK